MILVSQRELVVSVMQVYSSLILSQCIDGQRITIISEKEHLRDLGVTMSADSSFKQHIDNMCQSAKNMCAWILRTFQSRTPELILTLWKSMVIPILDYCSQLWSPSKVGEIKQI